MARAFAALAVAQNILAKASTFAFCLYKTSIKPPCWSRKLAAHQHPLTFIWASSLGIIVKMHTLIFELGCEDLPALQIEMAIAALKAGFESRCAEARISHGPIEAHSTPRRLALLVSNIADFQEDLSQLKVGPAVAASRLPDGTLSPAALGFLTGLGLTEDALEEVVQEKKKGKPIAYIAARISEKGRPTQELLGPILEQSLAAIHWAKPMRWSDEPTLFARPVHWILARLDDDVLHMRFAGIDSSGHSFGHRFMAPAPITIRKASDYIPLLKQAYVLASIEERKIVVEAQSKAVAESIGGHLVENAELLEEVVQILEWPVGIVGSFDPEFLKLPREVLETTMCKNQRYFSVVDDQGNLMPNFVTLSNTDVRDKSVVARGNERVLHARLKDAEFFYAEDVRYKLAHYLEKLKLVRYIDGLGSVYDKSLRIENLAIEIAKHWKGDCDTNAIAHCARLAKADLATGMVGEFPEVQGIMGDYYARYEGIDEAVAIGIREHYAPRQAGGAVATTTTGAIVGIADKLDTIVSLFALGKIPTGAADPFALRRSAVGIIRTLAEHKQDFTLERLIAFAIARVTLDLEALGTKKAFASEEALAQSISEFFTTRLRFFLSERYPTEIVEAVISVSPLGDFPSIIGRVAALSKHRNSDMFVSLMTTFKRVANIVRQAEDEALPEIDPKRFEVDAEHEFAAASQEVSTQYAQALANADYDLALSLLERLHAPADAFFDAVLVNSPDDDIRKNRLALLAKVEALFAQFCDVRKI